MRKMLVSAALLCWCAGAASAQFADFDAETEGFLGETYTTGGITFFDANNVSGFYPDGTPFGADELGSELIIEQSTVVWNDFPDFVSLPNTLTFGTAFIPGDNVTIGPLATASMSAAGSFTSGALDLIYYENGPWGGITVTLDALLNGQVVGSTSFVVAGDDPNGRDNPAAVHLAVDAPAFDSMRIYATLNGEYTTIRGLLDNVAMVPAPGALAVAGVGLLAGARRRRV
ncbi:MAG TPA: PEP-CTERM sorting domain-containing protein [Phycisphaerales bacterium]|nr:PEP-CTERM sorting domain-containing protein [Phycisphaerales bacterium]